VSVICQGLTNLDRAINRNFSGGKYRLLGKHQLKLAFKVVWRALVALGVFIVAVVALYGILYAVNLVPENLQELINHGVGTLDRWLE